MRLTLLWGALFLAGGIILLLLTYVLVAESLKTSAAGIAFTTTKGDAVITGPGSSPLPAPAASGPPLPSDVRDRIVRDRREFQDAALSSLLTRGSVALAIVTLVGMAFGWLLAERALRPLALITETARRVAGRNLHERIALDGPRDEIRELADTFDSMLERLDRAFDSQRMFVGNASHELRTPLAINRTLIEVAVAGQDVPLEMRLLGATLLAVADRQERMLDGLLTLAQSEQGLTVREPVDLSDVVRHILDQTPLNNLALRHHLGPAPTMGDPVLLERLVQNLIQNAVAYNVKDGWVDVRAGLVGTEVWLSVANTGPTVPQYEVQSLFEPFRRLRDRIGSAHGTGLGLSIVRSVAQAHDGTVTATPRDEGGGLVVRVTLPANKN